MPVTYKPTNVVISPFIRYSGTCAYTVLQRKSLTLRVDPFANPRAVLILYRIITLAPMAKYNGNERFLATLSGYTELPFELCVAFILTIGD